MEITLSILLGIGLAAACGFRVFVPFLIVSIAAMSGHLELTPGFEWIGTPYALAAFGAATALEIAAYYIPWLDNLLDAAATPAGLVQAGTVTLRGTSTATTGGIANPAVSTGELGGSVVTSTLSIIWPIVAFVLVVLLCVWIARRLIRVRARLRA